MESMFKREFDLGLFNRRVHSFMRRQNGIKPNVLMVNLRDYEEIRATVGAEYLRYAYTESDFDSLSCSARSPIRCEMKIQDIKLIINRECKEPVLALVEGM